jgi:hypothetical protein
VVVAAAADTGHASANVSAPNTPMRFMRVSLSNKHAAPDVRLPPTPVFSWLPLGEALYLWGTALLV